MKNIPSPHCVLSYSLKAAYLSIWGQLNRLTGLTYCSDGQAQWDYWTRNGRMWCDGAWCPTTVKWMSKYVMWTVTPCHMTFLKNTKMGNPMCDQCSGTRVIREENCFWPSGKTVHHGCEMNVSAGRWERLHPLTWLKWRSGTWNVVRGALMCRWNS